GPRRRSKIRKFGGLPAPEILPLARGYRGICDGTEILARHRQARSRLRSSARWTPRICRGMQNRGEIGLFARFIFPRAHDDSNLFPDAFGNPRLPACRQRSPRVALHAPLPGPEVALNSARINL